MSFVQVYPRILVIFELKSYCDQCPEGWGISVVLVGYILVILSVLAVAIVAYQAPIPLFPRRRLDRNTCRDGSL